MKVSGLKGSLNVADAMSGRCLFRMPVKKKVFSLCKSNLIAVIGMFLLFAAGVSTSVNAQSSLPVDAGELVATCFSGFANGAVCDPKFSPPSIDPNAPVLVLFDVRDPAGNGASLDVNWQPPAFHNEPAGNPDYWSAAVLGQVFGVALGTGASPDIFVTATRAYGDWPDDQTGIFGPGGAGGVYKISGTTGAVCVLTSLPQPPPAPVGAMTPTGTGLGSLAIMSTTGGQEFAFVSNFDDGLIYRIPTANCDVSSDGLMTFDHGVTALSLAGQTAVPDVPSQRFTNVNRRVFGLGFNTDDSRLYYGVWGTGEVWSVEISTTTGEFNPATARSEFTKPFNGQPIAGITFSPSGHLFLAERTMISDTGELHQCVAPAHASRVLEYRLVGGMWTDQPPSKYEVGAIEIQTNASGGVAVDCDDNVWVTADAIHFTSTDPDLDTGHPDRIYGLQRIPNGGNAGLSTSTSYVIDLDGNTAVVAEALDKTHIGQVAINNQCQTCTFESDNVLCELDAEGQLTGDFVVTGTFTNLQDIPGTHLLLLPSPTPSDGVTRCFGSGKQVFPLDDPVNNGESFEVGADPSNSDAIIIKNAMPGDEVCIDLILFGDNGEECCHIEVCFTMPPCDCLQVDRRLNEINHLASNADGTVDFSYTFQLTNLFGQDVYHSFLVPNGGETFSPDYFDLVAENGGTPLGHGQSVDLTTTVFGAQPHDLVSFLILIHAQDLSVCCSRDHDVLSPEHVIPLPDVPSGDINLDGAVNFQDIPAFISLLTSGTFQAEADCDDNGVVDFLDIPPFIAMLTQN